MAHQHAGAAAAVVGNRKLAVGPTTLTSKFTSRSPLTLGELVPMPCAVWHTEQVTVLPDMAAS